MVTTPPAISLRALLIEDSEIDAELLLRELRRGGFEVMSRRVQTAPALQEALRESEWDVVLSDYKMPDFNGMEALALVKASGLDLPFILISGAVGEEIAVAAMRAGANDYFVKRSLARLPAAINRELREAESRRAFRASEARVRQLFHAVQQAPVSFVITDVEGRIEYVNPKFTDLTGYSLEEVRGKNPRLLKSGAQGPEVYRELWTTIRSGNEWNGELRNRAKDGTFFWELTSISPIRDEEGKITHFLAAKLDITAKKRLEEQFLRAQRLESIGMLAAGIAHDLNNVLAPILMGVPLLRDITKSERDLRLLTTLEQSAERGAGLVKQILGFIHGIGGEPRLVQVKHLLRDVSAVIHETFPKSIQLQDDVPRDLWPILANPTQVHQIVLNLCVNARDAMPTGGTLCLRAENLLLDEAAASRIEGARSGAWIVIEVADTGTGIPPDVLAHIWDPFFTTKAVGKGTGLGLPTVRGIVTAHHGFSVVDSTPGRGTTFRIHLPAADSSRTADASTAAAAPGRGNGELILLVDDEETIRSVGAAILTQFGYRVITAIDGTDALAQFMPRAAEVALVITDLDMPNLDGAGLAQILHRMSPQLKIIAMSGLERRDVTVRPSELATAFIEKPFSITTLLKFVQQLLRTEPASPP